MSEEKEKAIPIPIVIRKPASLPLLGKLPVMKLPSANQGHKTNPSDVIKFLSGVAAGSSNSSNNNSNSAGNNNGALKQPQMTMMHKSRVSVDNPDNYSINMKTFERRIKKSSEKYGEDGYTVNMSEEGDIQSIEAPADEFLCISNSTRGSLLEGRLMGNAVNLSDAKKEPCCYYMMEMSPTVVGGVSSFELHLTPIGNSYKFDPPPVGSLTKSSEDLDLDQDRIDIQKQSLNRLVEASQKRKMEERKLEDMKKGKYGHAVDKDNNPIDRHGGLYSESVKDTIDKDGKDLIFADTSDANAVDFSVGFADDAEAQHLRAEQAEQSTKEDNAQDLGDDFDDEEEIDNLFDEEDSEEVEDDVAYIGGDDEHVDFMKKREDKVSRQLERDQIELNSAKDSNKPINEEFRGTTLERQKLRNLFGGGDEEEPSSTNAALMAANAANAAQQRSKQTSPLPPSKADFSPANPKTKAVVVAEEAAVKSDVEFVELFKRMVKSGGSGSAGGALSQEIVKEKISDPYWKYLLKVRNPSKEEKKAAKEEIQKRVIALLLTIAEQESRDGVPFWKLKK